MSDYIQTLVIGAGVVGLAVARQLALAGHEVVVLEKEKTIGSGISARNSEVIHAGLYYPRNSLKTQHCVKGRKLLYEFCRSHNVSHKQCGKLVVATDESQVAELETLLKSGQANGVEDLELIDQETLRRKEPALKGVAALWCPVSGIIDSHGLMLALQGDAEKAGAVIALQASVKKIIYDGKEFTVFTEQGAVLKTSHIVNCAGLSSVAVAGAVEGLDKTTIPAAYLAKGNYFTLGRKSPFTHLVYPLPEPGGLGVHLTLDLAGQARFGPDVEWIDEEDYVVNPERGQSFYAAIRRYWPDLCDGDLLPGYAGIRPKITPRGAPNADFVIKDENDHGIAGLINLFGIESPGLTSSLSLAAEVENRLQK